MSKKEPKNIETRPLLKPVPQQNEAAEKSQPAQPQYRIRNKSAHYVNYDIPGFGSCYIPPFSISTHEFYASELAGKQVVNGVRSGEIAIVKV